MNKQYGHHRKLTSAFYLVMVIVPKPIVKMIYQIFRNVEGSIGLGIRYICFKKLAKKCGDNVAIFPNTTLKHIYKMSVGNNVSIHTMCYLDASGEIEIGDNVSIAHSTSIISFDHTYEDKSLPIKYNKVRLGKITIFNDVWIGCGCRLLQGITIEERCIIAAGAVVSKNCMRNSIYGGVPAKKIKSI